MIYFDNNATTRVLDKVAAAMRPYLVEHFANPASAIGQFAGLSRVIASTKVAMADILGAESGEQIIVTSGATEANNLALLGAARANPQRRHLITSAIEHPSVMEVVAFMETTGYRVTRLPVTSGGVVRAADLRTALSTDTLIVSLMLANNETGVIQPVSELARLVKEFDPAILVHTDATQAVGKIPIDLGGELLPVDLLAISAHKFHGPKGVGALIIRDAETVSPLLYGGGQQLGLRPGTENPASLVGMWTALDALTSVEDSFVPVEILRDEIQRRLLLLHAGAFVLGADESRLPNTLSICLPGIDGADLVDRLAAAGIAISTGSACAHGADQPSHVALAMGLSHQQAGCCIRISLSLETTQEEADGLCNTMSLLTQTNANTV